MKHLISTIAVIACVSLAGSGCEQERPIATAAAPAATSSSGFVAAETSPNAGVLDDAVLAFDAAAAETVADLRATVVDELELQLSRADSSSAFAANVLAAQRSEVARLERRQKELQTEYEALHLASAAFALEHRQAVAAIALGVVGGGVSLDDSGRFTDDQRVVGGITLIVATIYALNNMSEVAFVVRELGWAADRLDSLEKQRAVAGAELATARATEAQLAANATELRGKAEALRSRLALL